MDTRLSAAGIELSSDPVATWRRLRGAQGARATIIDLYELVARQRGLTARELPAADRQALAHSVMPDIWPDFDVTSGSDRTGDPIEIEEYDPSGPERYEAWRQTLQVALGDAAARIEHVGSTAVPGLLAKPIIDIQVSVSDLDREDVYVPGLQFIGLQLRTRDRFHRYFRPFPGQPREVHVHVCEASSQWETEHLEFRDHLRTHPEACERYAEAKRDAAAKWADDRLAYTDAKTEVVLSILGEVG